MDSIDMAMAWDQVADAILYAYNYYDPEEEEEQVLSADDARAAKIRAAGLVVLAELEAREISPEYILSLMGRGAAWEEEGDAFRSQPQQPQKRGSVADMRASGGFRTRRR